MPPKARRNSPSKRFSKLDIDAPGAAGEPEAPALLPAEPPRLRRFAHLEPDDPTVPRGAPLEPGRDRRDAQRIRRFARIESDPAGAGTGEPDDPTRARARREIPPTPTQFEAFQTLFDQLNRVLFAGELPQVLLNFSRHNGALGFFAPDRWIGARPDVTAHEISLNPEYLRTRPPIEVASTLAHEMSHLWQAEKGTPSRSGYHNSQWAAKMMQIGLMPTDTGSPGGKTTGQRMTHFIIPGGAFQRAFEALDHKEFPWQHIARVTSTPAGPPTAPGGVTPPPDAPQPKAKNKVRYHCPICGLNVWGKPGLPIACLRDVAPLDEHA